MRDTTLFYAISGFPPESKAANKGKAPQPTSPSCAYIEEGHMMEYIMVGSKEKKVVALFFGPGEFLLQCHPSFSCILTLDQGVTQTFDYGGIFRLLRKHRESWTHYRHIHRTYLDKVAARIKSLSTLSPSQRFDELLRLQPWVFQLAEKDDIASYLRISMKMLQEMIK
jgi:hypothetical protein